MPTPMTVIATSTGTPALTLAAALRRRGSFPVAGRSHEAAVSALPGSPCPMPALHTGSIRQTATSGRSRTRQRRSRPFLPGKVDRETLLSRQDSFAGRPAGPLPVEVPPLSFVCPRAAEAPQKVASFTDSVVSVASDGKYVYDSLFGGQGSIAYMPAAGGERDDAFDGHRSIDDKQRRSRLA
jgi:hypothetical protein